MKFNPRVCKECGETFIPVSGRQYYCKKDHYRNCPVCGKPTLVKYLGEPTRACSDKCRRVLMEQTNLERYGTTDAGNTDAALKKRRATNLSKYGYEDAGNRPEAKEKRKNTNLERYGVENAGASVQATAQRIATNLERYGVENAMESAEVQQRSRAGLFKKYGVYNPRHTPNYDEKVHQISLEKYGVDHYITSDVVRAKTRATNLAKYGVVNPVQNPQVQAKIRATSKSLYGVSTCLNLEQNQEAARASLKALYGVEFPGQSDELRQRGVESSMKKYGHPYPISGQISQVNRAVQNKLSLMGVSSSTEFYLAPKLFDLHIEGSNIVIEIDPTYTHNIIGNHWGPGVDKNYHLEKSKLAAEHGYRCIHIFDWDDVNKLVVMLRPKEPIYARKCVVRDVDVRTANLFLTTHHLQGKVNSQKICLGLYHQGSLVQVMTFGSPRYNKKFEYELLRLCSDNRYAVVGGAEKLWKYFISTYNPQSVISYCDRAKFIGDVYSRLGMKLDHTTEPNKIWSKGVRNITNNLLLQRGYDQLFDTNYGKGTSNEELMLDNGWLPVYDCGQSVYTWIA